MKIPRYEGDQEVTIPESTRIDATKGNGYRSPSSFWARKSPRGKSAAGTACVTLEFVHTRRVAAFLLGAWLGGSLMMILIQTANLRFTSTLLSTSSDQATAFMKQGAPQQDFGLILKYQASEQNRRYTEIWEDTQFGLALTLAATMFLGTQRRIFPMVFCGLMLIMLLFEHVGVSPQLAYIGRETDFPPGSTNLGLLVRMYGLGQIYAWVEGSKLVLGVLLAGYLFIFRTRRTRKQVSPIDQPHHSPIDR